MERTLGVAEELGLLLSTKDVLDTIWQLPVCRGKLESYATRILLRGTVYPTCCDCELATIYIGERHVSIDCGDERVTALVAAGDITLTRGVIRKGEVIVTSHTFIVVPPGVKPRFTVQPFRVIHGWRVYRVSSPPVPPWVVNLAFLAAAQRLSSPLYRRQARRRP